MTIPARELRANDLLVFRSRFRTVRADAVVDMTDDGEAFVVVPLEHMTGQPDEAFFAADEPVAILR